MTGQRAWAVEYLRGGNGHISFRAAYLLHARHGWIVWTIAMGVFAAVACDVARKARQR